MHAKWPAALVVALGVVYATGHVLWFSATPLGLFPVLDGREILELATRIATGSVAPEPFYRAMLYPGVLALAIDPGDPPHALAFAARGINFLCHLLNALLIAMLARRLGASGNAAAVSATAWLVYPVALHFVVDPLDITLAITCMLAGLLGATRVPATTASRVLASTMFALAVLTRPQMLTILVAWWMWQLALVVRAPRTAETARHCIAVFAPALALLLAVGALNHGVSGEFRVLPWQGAYNLWAANRSGAHGLYYEQSRVQQNYRAGGNPARAESLAQFSSAHPDTAPTPGAINSYWRARLREDIVSDPLAWLVRLAHKARHVVGNFEHYNNKTYAFHKAQSPWLRHNPLAWSVVLALGAAGFVVCWCRPQARLLAWLLLAYGAGLVLTYVSARFRLPLAALLLIPAAGLGAAASAERRRRSVALAVAGLALAAALYPPDAELTGRTLVQDELLTARAAVAVRAHAQAEAAARAALARSPDHALGEELLCVARFNAWLDSERLNDTPENLVDECGRAGRHSAIAQRIQATLWWRQGQHERARAVWADLVRLGGVARPAALAALVWTSANTAQGMTTRIAVRPDTDTQLLVALTARGDAAAGRALAARLSPQQIAREMRVMGALYGVAARTSPGSRVR